VKGMAEHYYTVGVHGAPTPETAPHGYKWQPPRTDFWFAGSDCTIKGKDTKWWPLPAPPTEQAPPPEPVARWTARNLGCGWSSLRCGPDLNHPSHEDATAAADALNTLDRDGVAWGPGRPMSELPDGGAVLLLDDEGAFCVLPIETVFAWSVFVCWWPLPEATT